MRKYTYVVECEDCKVIENCATQLQRERWIFRHHIGHTIYTWRRRTERVAS